ncbi:multidrug resistance-associated ABC transporter [Cubamyces menziesii]|nr:multidrug resistance-associated ABC transporter [Cubamyces menziesii]
MEHDQADVGLEDSEGHGLKGLVQRSGGRVVLTYKIARLLSCIALLCLAIATVCNGLLGTDLSDSSPSDWPMFAQCAVYLYCTILAVLSVSAPRYSSLVSSHLSFVLLLTWAVYVYRDVIPLGTTTRSPADAHEGTLLWVKFAVLTISAIVIPVLVPRPPLDAEAVNEEQSAGWFERRMFSWLNETVAKAHCVKHLPLDELPPLARSDSTAVLVDESLKHLDPLQTKSKRHLFWGFLSLYRREYALAALLTASTSIIGLTWPLATQGILASLEAGSASTIRPWVWLSVLFLGPLVEMVCEEWYAWTMNRMSVRTEAIVTELLFQHALRIRVKSEASGEDLRDEPASAGAGDGDATSEPAGKEKPKDGFLVGKLNNLITSDLASVTEGNREWLRLFFQSPTRIGIAIAFMYSVLGWSALVGLATLLALLPFPGYLSAWIQSFQKGMMSTTDARVQIINEVLNVIRMIKLFGWEPRVAAQIEERRLAELKFLSKTRWLEILNNLFNYVIPLITMVVTFATYTVLMKGELTASKLFSSNAAFLIIQQQMHAIFFQIPVLTQGKCHDSRVSHITKLTELLDEFTEVTTPQSIIPSPTLDLSTSESPSSDVIGIKQTSFTWSVNDGSQVSTPATAGSQQSRKFVLNIDGEVIFKRGRMNLILGPTGSGKTSLLMALLGEMHARLMGPESFVSLPRTGGVAYAAQESWVLSDTIRNNILFGAPFDEVRYAKVIKQCALERDLSLFDAGDKTEVGEKGITLSGGQKARITLARAIYSSAEILLLDDVLAALDVHTGRWIVDQCFKGDLVRGRTVLLVSHNVALTRPIADFVVALGSDGRIASQGSLEKTLREDMELLAELAEEEAQLKHADEAFSQSEHESENAQKDGDQSGKLIVAEEVEEGQVGWKTIRLYLMNTSSRPLLYWTVYLLMLAVTHSVMNTQSYLLGYWAAQYETHAPSEVSVAYYLSLYGIIVLATMSAYFVVWFFYITGSMHASRVLHSRLVSSILGTTLRWLDITPTSRVIARCTSDIQAIDTSVPRYLLGVLECTVFMLLRVLATALMAPIFIVFAFVVFLAGGAIGRIYVKAQMCVKRELSNTRAPVLGHFGSAISGLVSIRAYGAQDMFKQESYLRLDRYNRAALIYNGLNRWVTVRVDSMGNVLSLALAAYIIYVARLSASDAGFAMTMAAGFSINVLFWVRTVNHLQVCGEFPSIERVKQYLSIEQEPKPSASGIPPAYWPASGDLRVEKLSARYSADGPRVLHEISFEVKSGERIGIVGRTGSGKSSLTLALLRCILTEGKVYYDGIATDSINLDALRSNITIIPQTPELLSGTLRRNLDPFEQHDDATLNDALRSAGLFSLQENMNAENGARLTLDSEIAGGGGNLSVGQRQILALARAIVRRSKLLILDEATSAIDYDTDAIIQNSLREELGRDVTVITVAHRLQSVMDADKIMVLDAGRIVEYDAPRVLLQKEGGYFRSLVDGSGDKAALYAQAGCAL